MKLLASPKEERTAWQQARDEGYSLAGFIGLYFLVGGSLIAFVLVFGQIGNLTLPMAKGNMLTLVPWMGFMVWLIWQYFSWLQKVAEGKKKARDYAPRKFR